MMLHREAKALTKAFHDEWERQAETYPGEGHEIYYGLDREFEMMRDALGETFEKPNQRLHFMRDARPASAVTRSKKFAANPDQEGK